WQWHPGPQARPDASAGLAVKLGYPVATAGETDRQCRHAEHLTPTVIGAAEVLELGQGQSQLLVEGAERLTHEVEGEGVVPGRDRGVNGEQGIGRNHLAGGREVEPTDHQLTATLQGHESAVSLVHVPTAGTD